MWIHIIIVINKDGLAFISHNKHLSCTYVGRRAAPLLSAITGFILQMKLIGKWLAQSGKARNETQAVQLRGPYS